MRVMTFRRGFTLIEMLVVLAIIALLLTLSVPRYFGSLNRSKELVLQENLQTLRHVLDKYQADKGRYPETLEALVEARYLGEVPVDPITESRKTWRLIAPPPGARDGIADVRSGAEGVGLDGRAYADY